MRGAVVVAAVLAVSAWVACGRSYDTADTPQGAQGQACYPNGTCLGGLGCTNGTCVIAAADASGGLEASVVVGGDASGSTTSSSSSASLSSSSSSGVVASQGTQDCADLSEAAYVTCPSGKNDTTCTSQSPQCCVGSGCQADGTSCAALAFDCTSDAHCGAEKGRCCVSGSLGKPALDCQGTGATFSAAPRCTLQAPCAAAELELCSVGAAGNGTCPTGTKCTAALVSLSGADGRTYLKTVGVCH